MIVIGDIHAKSKEPFRSSILKFFDSMLFKYSEETVILCGDLFDTSAPHNDIIYEIVYKLLLFKKIYIINGNHDNSKIKGSVLLPFSHHDSIEVLNLVTEITIENKKCIFIPYAYNNMREEYEGLEGNYDFIFTHITPLECAFGEEGMDLKLEGTYIHGHTHIQKDFTDKHDNKHYVLGVPLPTRHLEQNQDHRILKIDDEFTFAPVEQYFTYETINFGDEVKDKNNIINVKNAPSVQAVLDKYKGFYIREEGIEITYGDGSQQNVVKFDEESIAKQFVIFCAESNIDDGLKDFSLNYII